MPSISFPWLLSAAAEGQAAMVSTKDPVSQSIVAVIIIAVFALLASEKAHRVLIAGGAVALIWTITYLTPFHLITFEGSAQALDLNVLVLLAGMMAIVGVLKTTGVFTTAVAKVLAAARGNPMVVMVLITWFTATLSALCDNVTTVIFVAPMVIPMARALGVPPVAFLLPVVMASNVGGTATLIGDPPNIMIGSGAGLTFMDFIRNVTPPILVMTMVLPALSARYFRTEMAGAHPADQQAAVEVPSVVDPRLLKWALWISGFVFLGFFTHGITGMPTAVPATIGAIALLIVQDVLYLRTHKPTHGERVHGILSVIEKEIEWPTLSFFGFLFIAVGSAVQTGLIDTLATQLGRAIHSGSAYFDLQGAGTLLFAALLICWVSGFLSALIDNIPFVAVMIPIIHRLSAELPGNTQVLWWALSLGACLGGNGTPIGASANVTVIGIAERMGYRITFGEFTRFGSFITAITLVISSIFLALHVFHGGLIAVLIPIGIFALYGAWKLAARFIRPAGPRVAPLG